jgi:hypothetical protein
MILTSVNAAMASQPFAVPVDEAASSITVEICLGSDCDSDTSGVSGETVISLSPGNSPMLITLDDFDLTLTDTIDIYIPVFLGSLTATGEDIRLLYAEPGVPFGPVLTNNDMFSFVGVPTLSEGTVAYNAAGSLCVVLQAAGLPCNDTRNLADEGSQAGDITGTIVISDGIVTLTVNPDVEVPLDPNTPELGSMHITGTVIGSAPLPQDAVPTLSAWGIVLMTLSLLTAGSLVFIRRSLRSGSGVR